MSAQFSVDSGVRQGSCLSPAIFNVFMNVFIVHLKLLNKNIFFLYDSLW